MNKNCYILLILICWSCANKGQNNIKQEGLMKFTSLELALENKPYVYQLVLMNDSRFNEIPIELFELNELRVLSITGIDCDYIDNTKCSNIEHIPSDIQKLNKLEELYLVMNNINTIPNSFNSLQRLRILDLSDNFGINLKNIYELSNLEELNLNGCNIDRLDDRIIELKSLKKLGLENNPISDVEIDRLKKLLPFCEIYY